MSNHNLAHAEKRSKKMLPQFTDEHNVLQKPRYKQGKLLQLKEELPKLTKAEIRRHRIEYHEAILIELEEEGFSNSAEFLRQLFQFQDDYRKEHRYDFIILSRPVLMKDKTEIERLYKVLRTAESEHYKGNIAGEIDELLKLAYGYCFGEQDWWWIGEQLFAQAISISESYTADENMRKTMCYYLYGRYLVEQLKNANIGLEFLNSARVMSQNKKWCAKKITNHLEKYIFVEVCTVIYHTLIKQVKMTLKFDAHRALQLCFEAKARGIDGCLPAAEIFYLQGKCEMEIGQAQKAVGSFLKSHLLYKSRKEIEQSCEAMICLALAYLELNKWSATIEHLQSLLAFAEEMKLPYFVAQAYLYMGQCHLNYGTTEYATPFLVKSLNIFHEIGDVPHREFVKNLGAVSKGQETFGDYVQLILRCEDWKDPGRRKRNLQRLLSWKNKRTPFWEEVAESMEGASEHLIDMPEIVDSESGETEESSIHSGAFVAPFNIYTSL